MNTLPQGLNVAHLNARSLRTKADELGMILNRFKVDVMTISETWLSPQTESTCISIQNYTCARQDRSQYLNAKGRGLVTYVKSCFNMDVNKHSNLNTCTADIEAMIVEVTRGNRKKTIIVNLYRPPSGNQAVFLEAIPEILQTVSRERYADIFLLGDMNLDHTPDTMSDITHQLSITLNSFGLKQHITCPTRVTGRKKTLIDVAYIRTSKNIHPYIIQISLSDHYLVGCTRYLGYSKPEMSTFTGQTYKKYSFENAKKYYNTHFSSNIHELTDVNLIWNEILKQITHCASKLCPIKT